MTTSKTIMEHLRPNEKRFQFKIYSEAYNEVFDCVQMNEQGRPDVIRDQRNNCHYAPSKGKNIVLQFTTIKDGDGQDLWEYDAVKVRGEYRNNQDGVVMFIDGCWTVRFLEANEQGQVLDMLAGLSKNITRLGCSLIQS